MFILKKENLFFCRPVLSESDSPSRLCFGVDVFWNIEHVNWIWCRTSFWKSISICASPTMNGTLFNLHMREKRSEYRAFFTFRLISWKILLLREKQSKHSIPNGTKYKVFKSKSIRKTVWKINIFLLI